MKKASVVIGANFGDEGKGLVTDFLAQENAGNALVVRFNGGAQAAHTVQTPQGQRHVFSHFGSGSFSGAPTLLSRFFVCNPILFLKELATLEGFGLTPQVFVDPSAYVTTPYDMMINQIVEESRGKNRHGSCGMGFGETIERCEASPFTLVYADLANTEDLREKLTQIQTQWVLPRLEQLGVTSVSAEWKERVLSADIRERFIKDVENMRAHSQQADKDMLARTTRNVVFEGAQGLLLDQNGKWFPHVTRSNTGLKNALVLAKEAGFDALDTYYITRAYLTRHGAGPLPGEMQGVPYPKVSDPTNVHNPWQGTLRFAFLDATLLADTIKDDLAHAGDRGAMQVNPMLAVTCLDQLEASARVIEQGSAKDMPAETLAQYLLRQTGFVGGLTSHGPTRQTIRRI